MESIQLNKKSRESSILNMGNMLHTSIRVKGESKIVIAEGCRIRHASFNIKGDINRLEFDENVFFSGSIELFGDGNTIKIGKDTRINGADLIVHNGTKVEIGSRCLFSTKIDVRTTDSHFIFNSDGKRINHDKNIFMGDHVWIGRMVSILKGSHIGDVVGSMSLVSGNIPNEVISAGVPAKTIIDKISWKA